MRRRVTIVSAITIATFVSVCLGMLGSPTSIIDLETVHYQDGTSRRELQQTAAGSVITLDEEMTIYSGYISLEVNKVTQSMKGISSLAQQIGGCITNSQISVYRSCTRGYVSMSPTKWV